MKRREFITLLGGAAAAPSALWPLAAHAQHGERMRRIGVLMNSAATDATWQSYLAAFVQSLRQLGWTEGQNLRIDTRWSAGDAALPITDFGAAFKGNCPLWAYILAETKQVMVSLNTKQGNKNIRTQQLGPVGGRIVAETLVGLLLSDGTSYFNQDPIWQPSKANAQGRFGLKEFILTALS